MGEYSFFATAFEGVDAPEKVPSEIRLLRAGANEYAAGSGQDASLVFDDDAAKSVMSRYQKRGLRLKADYEHQSLTNPPVIAPASAKKWTPEVRNGELWATDIQWTKKARQMIADGEYDYFSIAANVEKKSSRIVEIINFALTNNPAANGIEPFTASLTSTKENSMKTVAVALGLKAEADESDALGAITALKLRADKADELEADLAKASAELAKLKADHVAEQKKALIDEAIKDGVAPAKRPDLEALELSALKVCLSLLPKKAPAAVEPAADAPVASAASGLTADEMSVLKTTGLSPEKYLEHKAAYRRGFHKGEE